VEGRGCGGTPDHRGPVFTSLAEEHLSAHQLDVEAVVPDRGCMVVCVCMCVLIACVMRV
jgi:hypothetical protein